MPDANEPLHVHEVYTPLSAPRLPPCPVCGAPAALYQVQESPKAFPRRVVCCSRSEPIVPESPSHDEVMCFLNLPPQTLERATAREAMVVWAAMFNALTQLRNAFPFVTSSATETVAFERKRPDSSEGGET